MKIKASTLLVILPNILLINMGVIQVLLCRYLWVFFQKYSRVILYYIFLLTSVYSRSKYNYCFILRSLSLSPSFSLSFRNPSFIMIIFQNSIRKYFLYHYSNLICLFSLTLVNVIILFTFLYVEMLSRRLMCHRFQ